MNAWKHLPNADLIDWVIESLKTNPEKWALAEDADLTAARNAARNAARTAARVTAWNAARTAARVTAWYAARDAILALVVYDDCDQYLSMSYEQLLTYATLSERPQAVLLLPLKWVQEHETLVTFT